MALAVHGAGEIVSFASLSCQSIEEATEVDGADQKVCTTNPERNFGSNHVLLGGMI